MAEAARAGASVFFQDEASVRKDFRAGTTTWSAAGKTTVIKTTVDRYGLKMISSRGRLHISAPQMLGDPPLILQGTPERQSRFPVFLIDDGLLYGRFRKDQGMGPFNQWVTSTFLPRGLLSAIETRRIGFKECECGPYRQGLEVKCR